MTVPTETFDLRTAKDIAATLIRSDQPSDATIAALHELHARIFAALGDSPAAIAAKLTELGIKGTLPEVVRDGGELYGDLTDEDGCALAVLMRDVCGASEATIGSRHAAIFWNNTDGFELGSESVELPPVVQAFQDQYEDFVYPQLFTEPVPQEVVDFQNDPRKGIERFDYTTRGPVRQVDNRQKYSAPMPDNLVAAIGAAGLTAEDYADQVLLYRDGRLWALVQGMDGTPGSGHWTGQYGYLPDAPVFQSYQGLTCFDTRDAAVAYVLDNVGTTRMLQTRLPDGRWEYGPLTSGTRHRHMNDLVLVAAMAAGVTLVQEGAHALSQIEIFRGSDRLATVGMIPGGTWQAELTDGRTLNELGLDAMLATTIGALSPA